ncbi:hypothetical protein SK128_006465, partial [Halocaridina rubra]
GFGAGIVAFIETTLVQSAIAISKLTGGTYNRSDTTTLSLSSPCEAGEEHAQELLLENRTRHLL